ncbi:hypothetical protein A8H40_20585 [Burkholderia multivorans]|uniref:Uncharacterized protein n=2 Tax=Burkholderia multivorans TaxID=87883 RepID=A0A8E2USM5_9BURK|nr:hypothetical protein A8H40_20585 [Burkholderia multivorans]EED98512.1 putative lipoprotein [Burkholderia multivorans CGD1]EEE08171.1 putative lipoprotein [Burkholderia multivorans CGD2]EEE10480.1 putative lipoprotein [Burkholderia multivorans CGD2M]EJO52898.1 putative lipoprotein [Burkholderia multivorans ATCC BAA-247]
MHAFRHARIRSYTWYTSAGSCRRAVAASQDERSARARPPRRTFDNGRQRMATSNAYLSRFRCGPNDSGRMPSAVRASPRADDCRAAGGSRSC